MIEPTTVHTTGEGTVSLSRLFIPERMRRDTPEVRRYIDEELVPSIAEHGLIQTIVVRPSEQPDFDFDLVAGWCRTQSFIALGHESIPYSTRANLPDHELAALELEENLRRKDMTWQEKVLGIYTTHRKKSALAKAEGQPWGMRQSGKLLNVSHGHIGDMVKVAQELLRGNQAVLSAPKLTDAIKLMYDQKEDEAMRVLAERSGAVSIETSVESPTKRKSDSSVVVPPSAKGLDLATLQTSGPVNGQVEQAGETSIVKDLNVPLSDWLQHTDCLDFFDKAEPESVDMIFTDIPYGIDMDNLETLENIDRVKDEHDVEQNVELMLPFLQGAYKVLKDKAYCCFYYDIAHEEKLRKWAVQAGFKFQPFPVLWIKTHPCQNRAAHCHWTKQFEYIMVLRKGTATLRNTDNRPAYIMADGLPEKKAQMNPFSKPFEVSKQILQAICIPGDIVLDPFMGEASILRAVAQLGMSPRGCEISDLHYPRALENMKNVYRTLTRNKAEFS